MVDLENNEEAASQGGFATSRPFKSQNETWANSSRILHTLELRILINFLVFLRSDEQTAQLPGRHARLLGAQLRVPRSFRKNLKQFQLRGPKIKVPAF